MTEALTESGYRATKDKLAAMEARLADLQQRTDVHPSVRSAAERSYQDMMRQYKREITLYELAHPIAADSLPTDAVNQVNSK